MQVDYRDEFEDADFDADEEGPSEADRRRFGSDHVAFDIDSLRCEECGAVMFVDADVCPKCGAFQMRNAKTRKDHVLARLIRHPIMIVVVVLIVIVIALLW